MAGHGTKRETAMRAAGFGALLALAAAGAAGDARAKEPLVDTTRTGASTAVSREQIEQLPMTSRDFRNIVAQTDLAGIRARAEQGHQIGKASIDGCSKLGIATGLGSLEALQGQTDSLIDSLESVSVLNGPADILGYGQSTGGVINFLRRDLQQSWKAKGCPDLRANFDFGAWPPGGNTATFRVFDQYRWNFLPQGEFIRLPADPFGGPMRFPVGPGGSAVIPDLKLGDQVIASAPCHQSAVVGGGLAGTNATVAVPPKPIKILMVPPQGQSCQDFATRERIEQSLRADHGASLGPGKGGQPPYIVKNYGAACEVVVTDFVPPAPPPGQPAAEACTVPTEPSSPRTASVPGQPYNLRFSTQGLNGGMTPYFLPYYPDGPSGAQPDDGFAIRQSELRYTSGLTDKLTWNFGVRYDVLPDVTGTANAVDKGWTAGLRYEIDRSWSTWRTQIGKTGQTTPEPKTAQDFWQWRDVPAIGGTSPETPFFFAPKWQMKLDIGGGMQQLDPPSAATGKPASTGTSVGFQPHWSLNGIKMDFTGVNGATFAEADKPLETQAPRPSDPYAASSGSWGQAFADQWGLRAINWLKADGSTVLPDKAVPIIVAVIDTGIDRRHPELIGATWINTREIPGNGVDDDGNGYVDDVYGWNYVDDNPNVTDLNGHGTVVAGIIAAGVDDGFGIAGINPWARIMPLKIADHRGRGGSVDLTKAIVYAVDNGARVINLSVGGKGLSRAEQLAIDYAAAKNVLVVVAAGNLGIDTAGFAPAGLNHVVTVAAVDPAGKRPAFNNWGAALGIAAPGTDILSLRAARTDLLLFQQKDYKPGSAFVGKHHYRISGSSFAAPMVAGVGSLILSVNPKLGAEQVRRMLLHSARDIEVPGRDLLTGYGLLDAAAALAADPAFYVDAAIAGVAAAKAGNKVVVRVNGTAAADRFKAAWIEIGEGEDPRDWRKVSRDITAPVANGVLDELDAGLFRGAKLWTLRLVTEHAGGKRREARYKLRLG